MEQVSPQDEQRVFEADVRRVAESLWPSAYGGSGLVDGRERDGVYESDDAVHLIEVTVSKKLEKAKQDLSKLVELHRKRKLTTRDKIVKAWWVVRDGLSPEQRREYDATLRRHSLTPADLAAVSFEEFRRKLIDVNEYLGLREKAPFGSIADPLTGDTSDTTEYISLDMVDRDSGAVVSVKELCRRLLEGGEQDRFFVLLGDFGAGKSMTLREAFRQLSGQARMGATTRFPMVLNLRDHHGQVRPHEALQRHADLIGFGARADHLVRAWRAGYAIPMLDGFDELATAKPIGSSKHLRNARYAATELIRNFVSETPANVPVVATGRTHYFDTDQELRKCLATRLKTSSLMLNEFTDAQIKEFLKRHGFALQLPEWLPSRPLLLGYLATSGLLDDVVAVGREEPPARAWPILLDRICKRESKQANIEPDELRHVLQRLATRARQSSDGLGPLGADEVWRTFADVCGREPDERGVVQLQRLPGLGLARNPLLGPGDAETQSRMFVDPEIADTARAEFVAELAASPFDSCKTHSADFPSWKYVLSDAGIDVLAEQIRSRGLKVGLVQTATEECARHAVGGSILAWELLTAASRLGLSLDQSEVTIGGIEIEEVSISDDALVLSHATLEDCYIGRLLYSKPGSSVRRPAFRRCAFESVEGAVGLPDLDGTLFSPDCQFDRFESSVATNTDIRSLPIPLGVRVGLTMLRKLFLQRGHGRRESALLRGLGGKERAIAGRVLQVIQRERVASTLGGKLSEVWLPNRSMRSEVLAALANPHNMDRPLLKELAAVK
ncbi:MAG: hypothetical protein FJ254_09450 [Phycisphaerae bacterium]|nr:hypothetical protein [Phycisphaerae bacterium]